MTAVQALYDAWLVEELPWKRRLKWVPHIHFKFHDLNIQDFTTMNRHYSFTLYMYCHLHGSDNFYCTLHELYDAWLVEELPWKRSTEMGSSHTLQVSWPEHSGLYNDESPLLFHLIHILLFAWFRQLLLHTAWYLQITSCKGEFYAGDEGK